jgi:ribokinase
MALARKPIVVVGSINIDLVARAERIPSPGETVTGDDFQVHPGGKGANQAVAVARLDYPVQLIGRLGNDSFAAQLREHLQSAGVDLAGLMTSEGSSGVAIIVVSRSGENCIVVTTGANALLSPQDLDDNVDIIRSAAMVLTQLEIPLETVRHLAAICRREGIPLMLDPAPARAVPADLLQNITWFTPNESEAAFFTGEAATPVSGTQAIAKELLARGPRNVVLKMGARGAYVATAEGADSTISPFAVEAVDTTAAGDCFNGAFATALCSGNGPSSSARFGAAAAAISVTRAGAQPSMPSASEVDALLDAAR